MTLDKLSAGETARVKRVNGEGAVRRRLLELGLTPRTQVTLRGCAPFGDPIAIAVRGGELTLRLEDARTIEVV